MNRLDMIRVLVNNKLLLDKIKGYTPSEREISLYYKAYDHNTDAQLKAMIMMNTY